MSTSDSPQQAAQEPFLATMRELVHTYQSFSAYSEAFVRQFDLTPAQFDVVATLGNTPGMTMGDIGDKTLITKGTLTGVVDRLEKKGLISREVPPENRRSVVVKLTPTGESLFDQVFPAHIADMKQHFEQLDASELELLRVLLQRLGQAFQTVP
ncbi:MarR family transcriptional regulator [filamentous cyanobacterium CCP5]|nr:MarR family transcriptional regulator [filamentous cyanobacterium CCP5]